ncbi:hypothetical protein CHS0354_041169 [Potamilus streckersoni]|uniref:Uncharacterized protein n=1 Tax=Potamilus streckersoni TaxID=2493646 RepID=A0AAE0SDQ5_9BIVA|nr:hypothetical protein CHS0354_041169 [Potamilus streckersoni]
MKDSTYATAIFGKLFQRNFGNFSELAIYTDFAARYADDNHFSKVRAVLNKLWAILCELQIGILSQGESISQDFNTSIISDQFLVDASSVEILFRNYVIIRVHTRSAVLESYL